MVVTGAHVEMALADLNEGGRLAQRLLGFRPVQEEPVAGEPRRTELAMPTGFPLGTSTARSTRREG